MASSWADTTRARQLFEVDRNSPAIKWGLPILGTTLILGSWYVLTDVLHLLPTVVLPSPTELADQYIQPNVRKVLLNSLSSTLVKFGIGYSTAATLGILTALLITLSTRAERTVVPLIVAGSSFPRIAIIPIMMFFVGGFTTAYIVAAWIAIFPIFMNAVEGLTIDEPEIDALLETFGATTWQEYKYFRWKNGLPFIFDGLKIGVPSAVIGAVVSEFIAANSGIGYLALIAMSNLNMPLLYADLLLMSFVSMTMFFILFLIQDHIVYWQDAVLLMEEEG